MPINPYAQQLHDQLQQLVQRGIACRRQLDTLSCGMRFSGDGLDMERLRQKLCAELQYLGNQKAKLRHELGLREPIGAIKLSVPVRARKSTAVWLDAPPQKSPAARLNEAKRTIAYRGYLTRDLGR